MTETKITYRVRPEHYGFSHEDFDTLTEAIEKANLRNSLRPTDYGTETVWKGHNCKIQKVTTTIEEITV